MVRYGPSAAMVDSLLDVTVAWHRELAGGSCCARRASRTVALGTTETGLPDGRTESMTIMAREFPSRTVSPVPDISRYHDSFRPGN